ncbi:DUF3558 domain-containing protein [Actinokineospora sp.]|uniref:DUF3558 domain-containing protein n=1 Tax=Actinokineospora sp. TaxID=1872133 RepID=UPI0040382C89
MSTSRHRDRIRYRDRVLALAAGVVLVSTACSTIATGTAVPAPGPTTRPNSDTTGPGSTTSAGANKRYGAPPVTVPLDANRYLAEPCALLTPAQMATFNITNPGIPVTTGAVAEYVGPYCSWRSDDTPRSRGFVVGLLPGNKNGLADTYRGRGQFEHFEPTTVDDYPAVFNNSPDLRSKGDCNITVGISETLTFNAAQNSTFDTAQTACDGAKKLASAVIATLKAGG